jgi:tripartite-type tricarboxylate transporter receptor subunit TctC
MKPLISLYAAAAALALAGPAAAQQYPTKTITLVVPFAPGGNTDGAARIFAPSLEKQLGQTVIVENRPGGGSAVGICHVGKSAPDGYTLSLAGAGAALLHLVNANMPCDNRTDVVPTTEVTDGWSLILAPSAAGAKNWNELVAMARKSPGKLNYATLGASSVTLAMAGLLSAAGNLSMVPIPYKGGADYTRGLLTNEVQLQINTIGFSKAHIEAGTLVPLLQVSEKRHPEYPSIPTVNELGYGDKIRPHAWNGLFSPKGTPQAILDRLAAASAVFAKDPAAIAAAAKSYNVLIGSTPAEFKKKYDADIAAWSKVAKEIGLKPE